MAKFITAREAAQLIPDHATVGVAGMGLSGWPEEIACAIRDNFAETGHPCDLNLKQASALGDWGYGNKFVGWDRSPLPEADTAHGNRGVTRFGEAGPGLITKWTSAHIGSAFTLCDQARQNQIPLSAAGRYHQPLERVCCRPSGPDHQDRSWYLR